LTESTVGERIAHHWYLRPVLFVSDLQAALRFYIDKLGFEKRWRSADGKGTVCQVNRGGCEIILWWGYDVIRITDPDGNELLFPLDETNDRERRT
jgi:glyoxalase/bleomycin resistance protein/dioxygenase superfamily protein